MKTQKSYKKKAIAKKTHCKKRGVAKKTQHKRKIHHVKKTKQKRVGGGYVDTFTANNPMNKQPSQPKKHSFFGRVLSSLPSFNGKPTVDEISTPPVTPTPSNRTTINHNEIIDKTIEMLIKTAYNYIRINAVCMNSTLKDKNTQRICDEQHKQINIDMKKLIGETLNLQFATEEQKIKIHNIIDVAQNLQLKKDKTPSFDFVINYKNAEEKQTNTYDVFEKYYNILNSVESDPIKSSTEEEAESSPPKEEPPLPPDDDEVLSPEEDNREEEDVVE